MNLLTWYVTRPTQMIGTIQVAALYGAHDISPSVSQPQARVQDFVGERAGEGSKIRNWYFPNIFDYLL